MKVPISDIYKRVFFLSLLIGFLGVILLIMKLNQLSIDKYISHVYSLLLCISLVFYFYRSKFGEIYRYIATVSMLPLGISLGENILGFSVFLIFLGGYIYLVFRPSRGHQENANTD